MAAIEAWPVARWLRFARWGYAAVATAHVAGMGLLLGAIVAFDLRLLGVRRDLPLVPLARLLLPVAAFGLALAIASGALLFATRATEYALLSIFLLKLALIAAGLGHALSIHFGPGLAGLSPQAQRRAGAVSLSIWLAVLICGRAIAFVSG